MLGGHPLRSKSVYEDGIHVIIHPSYSHARSVRSYIMKEWPNNDRDREQKQNASNPDGFTCSNQSCTPEEAQQHPPPLPSHAPPPSL